MRTLVKKLDSNSRLAPAILGRAPSFSVAAGVLADSMHEVLLSNGETVHLHLPHHTHLSPGDVLLDSMGMMVRVDAARQPVLSIQHADIGAIVSLALTAAKQGRAVGWAGSAKGGALLLDLDASLEAYLTQQGYQLDGAMGQLIMPSLALPLPADCGHAHGHEAHGHETHAHADSHDTHSHNTSHDHDHSHSHKHG